jgi:hypothetical protein
MSGHSRVNKTRRLLHINNLLKGTIEEDIMYIKLMNLPMVRYSNGKDEPNSSRFNNRTEGFRFINTFLLSESACNQGRLVTINNTIGPTLDFVNPTTTNNIHGRFKRNQGPSVIIM